MRWLILMFSFLPVFAQAPGATKLLSKEQREYRQAALDLGLAFRVPTAKGDQTARNLEGMLVFGGAVVQHSSTHSVTCQYGSALIMFGRVDDDAESRFRGTVVSTGRQSGYIAAGAGAAAAAMLSRHKNKEGWGLVGLVAGIMAHGRHLDILQAEYKAAYEIASLAAYFAATNKVWPETTNEELIEDLTRMELVEDPKSKPQITVRVDHQKVTLFDGINKGLFARSKGCKYVALKKDGPALIISYHKEP